MINQKEIQDILKKQGDVRGAVFQTDANYVLKKGSQGDLLKVENLLKEWNVGLQFKDVEAMGWYPISWRTFSLLAIKEALGWDDIQIREMGKNAPNVSIIVKLFFKLFPDIKKFAQQIPNYWRKHYTVGELEVGELDKDRQTMVIYLKNFSFHPVLCRYLEGYFEQATKLTRPEDSVVTAKEIQCSFNDNTPYEAYQLSWTK
ncbi:MAG: hypothetical protein Q7R99_00925 [bacterium]|nr:hypothetical protein [bacterium]